MKILELFGVRVMDHIKDLTFRNIRISFILIKKFLKLKVAYGHVVLKESVWLIKDFRFFS